MGLKGDSPEVNRASLFLLLLMSTDSSATCMWCTHTYTCALQLLSLVPSLRDECFLSNIFLISVSRGKKVKPAHQQGPPGTPALSHGPFTWKGTRPGSSSFFFQKVVLRTELPKASHPCAPTVGFATSRPLPCF